MGVLRCVHAVIPQMKKQGNGDIIVTSSISGHHDLHGEPVYSASKNAVQTFVHTVRRQLAPAGIRVMSLAAGTGCQSHARAARSQLISGVSQKKTAII